MGDKNYLQWVVSVGDARAQSSTTNSSSSNAHVMNNNTESLVAELINPSHTNVANNPVATPTVAAVVTTDVQQPQLQQHLLLGIQQHQPTTLAGNRMQPSSGSGAAFAQQLPLLHPIALAGSSSCTSNPQQLFFVRPVNQALAPGATLAAIPTTTYSQLVQQRNSLHRPLQQLNALFNTSAPINNNSSGCNSNIITTSVVSTMSPSLNFNSALSQNFQAATPSNSFPSTSTSNVVASISTQNVGKKITINNKYNAGSTTLNSSNTSDLFAPSTMSKTYAANKKFRQLLPTAGNEKCRDVQYRSTPDVEVISNKPETPSVAGGGQARLRVVMPPLQEDANESSQKDYGRPNSRKRSNGNADIFAPTFTTLVTTTAPTLTRNEHGNSLPLVTIHAPVTVDLEDIDIKHETTDVQSQSANNHFIDPISKCEVVIGEPYTLNQKDAREDGLEPIARKKARFSDEWDSTTRASAAKKSKPSPKCKKIRSERDQIERLNVTNLITLNKVISRVISQSPKKHQKESKKPKISSLESPKTSKNNGIFAAGSELPIPNNDRETVGSKLDGIALQSAKAVPVDSGKVNDIGGRELKVDFQKVKGKDVNSKQIFDQSQTLVNKNLATIVADKSHEKCKLTSPKRSPVKISIKKPNDETHRSLASDGDGNVCPNSNVASTVKGVFTELVQTALTMDSIRQKKMKLMKNLSSLADHNAKDTVLASLSSDEHNSLLDFNNSVSDDENSFTGFTEDMFIKSFINSDSINSSKTKKIEFPNIDLEKHSNSGLNLVNNKSGGDECDSKNSEKQIMQPKELDSQQQKLHEEKQRNIRQHLRIRFGTAAKDKVASDTKCSSDVCDKGQSNNSNDESVSNYDKGCSQDAGLASTLPPLTTGISCYTPYLHLLSSSCDLVFCWLRLQAVN